MDTTTKGAPWADGPFSVTLEFVGGRAWYQAHGPCLEGAATVSREAMVAHLQRAAEERREHHAALLRLAAELAQTV